MGYIQLSLFVWEHSAIRNKVETDPGLHSAFIFEKMQKKTDALNLDIFMQIADMA